MSRTPEGQILRTIRVPEGPKKVVASADGAVVPSSADVVVAPSAKRKLEFHSSDDEPEMKRVKKTETESDSEWKCPNGFTDCDCELTETEDEAEDQDETEDQDEAEVIERLKEMFLVNTLKFPDETRDGWRKDVLKMVDLFGIEFYTEGPYNGHNDCDRCNGLVVQLVDSNGQLQFVCRDCSTIVLPLDNVICQ